MFSFALGFLPDGAIQWVLQKSGLDFKRTNARAESLFTNTSTTVLDGVDYFTAFRLQEASIYDVQNLAAYNPIMLYVETPFSIYQTIDWVAQAQLCNVVGPERFLLFRGINIRTIFDLERAVLGIRSPPGLKWKIGSILFADSATQKRAREDLKMLPVDVSQRDEADPVGKPAATASWMNLDDIEYAVRVMIDDLHVHRLRQIWQFISDALGSGAEQLTHVERFRDEG